MNLLGQVRALHRAWRFRLNSERFGISFLFNRDLKGKTAVDAGANWGIYSYWMHSRVGAEGHVIAFEPQPELSAHLRELRDSFRLRRLEIAEMGLSSQIDELTLRRPKAHWGGATFESESEDSNYYDLIKAKVTTLDTYFENHPARPISFIKCDVEGHEHHVFRGGQNILLEDRPDLLFECYDAENPDCKEFSYLKSVDYEGFCFFGDGFAPISDYVSLRPRMHKKAVRDFVFVPKERARALTNR